MKKVSLFIESNYKDIEKEFHFFDMQNSGFVSFQTFQKMFGKA